MTRYGYPDQPKIKSARGRLLVVLGVILVVMLGTAYWIWPVWLVIIGLAVLLSMFVFVPYLASATFLWVRDGEWWSPREWWDEYGI